MAAPSALSFTTTTSPGITRMRKNTATATPISVGITKSKRRTMYQNMGCAWARGRGRRHRDAAGAIPLLVEPNRGEVLPEVVARCHVPALDLLVVDDDALPPQDR